MNRVALVGVKVVDNGQMVTEQRSDVPDKEVVQEGLAFDADLITLSSQTFLTKSSSDVSSQPTRTTSFELDDNRPIPVYVKVVFLKVGEIDTIKELFSADVFIQARWREPAFDHKEELDPDKIDFSDYWSPNIQVQNVEGEPKQQIWHTLKAEDDGNVYVIQKRRITGNFTESLELKEFPFDIQDLSVYITTDLSQADIDFLEEDRELSHVNAQNFVDQQEWSLYTHVEITRRVVTKEYANSRHKYPGMLVQCRVSRKPGFFLWNILLITLLISSLSFTTFSVSTTLPQNRLQLSFTLILTSVAFKFVLNQSLPKISYLTYLDIYVLASMVFLYVICAWHALIINFERDQSLSKTMDRAAFAVLLIFYLLFQIIFGGYIFFKSFKKRRLMSQKDRVHELKAESMADKQSTVKRGRDRGNLGVV